jgi:hypothetical protein
MKTENLICTFQGAAAIDLPTVDKRFKKLKSHEIRNLETFCRIMGNYGFSYENYDGFFVSYSIKQIGKEFDLLRFGDELILNVEIKSELKVANKLEKIRKQMEINHYYLKFLGKKIVIITYVENDGFYMYDSNQNIAVRMREVDAANVIKTHKVNLLIDPDKEFVPSNYLISPFNSTEQFINGEYFLTSPQQKVKTEIQEKFDLGEFAYFCIVANAGTGKTLLLYDIAKDYINRGTKVVLIHSGKLNDGHYKLSKLYGWKIYSVSSVDQISVNAILSQCEILLVDEAQRMRTKQIELIIECSKKKQFPIVYSYDPKQFLRDGEDRDIQDYLQTVHPDIQIYPHKLYTKIRTNKELASFITNLFDIGRSKVNLDYSCITIEYVSNERQLKEYISYLQNARGWQPLKYTTSIYNPDPFDALDSISDKNAHDVIGQEFSKVVFVMDGAFRYEGNRLTASKYAYYSPKGMLYQITTRVVDELKIIVFNNPDLYVKLLEIKEMGNPQ